MPPARKSDLSIHAAVTIGDIHIAYLNRCSVLMSAETRQVYHRSYTAMLCQHRHCLVTGYFASDRALVLKALSEECSATHLIVGKALLQGEEPPWYFKPFTKEDAQRWWCESQERGAAVMDVDAFPPIYENRRFRVIQGALENLTFEIPTK